MFQLCLWCYLAAFEMYVSPEIRCQIRGRNLVNVYYSKCCFKLEGMLIITAVPDIIMHSCAYYNIITVFYLGNKGWVSPTVSPPMGLQDLHSSRRFWDSVWLSDIHWKEHIWHRPGSSQRTWSWSQCCHSTLQDHQEPISVCCLLWQFFHLPPTHCASEGVPWFVKSGNHLQEQA